MAYKNIVKLLISISLFTYLCLHVRCTQGSIKTVCIDKITTQSRDGGRIYYNLIFKDQDGEIYDTETQVDDYYNKKIGTTYLRNKTNFYWK